MWVELGAALLHKPCTILTPTRDALPPCVRTDRPGLRIVENADPQVLLKAIGPQ